MAGKNFLGQVHTFISRMNSFLDATKVELGEKAKKVIGIIGIALTCILILASVLEGILGYSGRSNWFEGASVSPDRVPIPPGWNGAEDAAFTTAIAVLVFIFIPVAWGARGSVRLGIHLWESCWSSYI